MAARAALGFKLHTGWAVLVAVSFEGEKIGVPLRRRIDLLPSGDSIPRFVYHQASELPASQAPELIRRAETASGEAARIAVKDALDHLQSLGLTIKAAGIPSASRSIPKDLAVVLHSHPLIHTAEAILFRQAVSSACQRCGLDVVAMREREVWINAATACGWQEAKLRAQIDDLRKFLGAPWTADYKTATAMALLALQRAR